MENQSDRQYMLMAYKQAEKAFQKNEIPVGAVLVYQDEIIGEGYNTREHTHSVLGHAEIHAIQEASRKLKTWKLDGSTLYVTHEPCPMCAGTILQSRIRRVVYGAANPKAGAVDSCCKLFEVEGFHHRVEVIQGVHKEACEQIIQEFFKKMRKENARKTNTT